jgi:hypothetical protein
MRDYLQLIGHALQNQCPIDTQSLLLYAEVEWNVIGSSVFYTTTPGVAVFRYASQELEDLTYELWEVGQEKLPAKSWAAIEYMLVGSKLDVALTYREQFIEHEGENDRRPRVIARRSPGSKVNFSNPGT